MKFTSVLVVTSMTGLVIALPQVMQLHRLSLLTSASVVPSRASSATLRPTPVILTGHTSSVPIVYPSAPSVPSGRPSAPVIPTLRPSVPAVPSGGPKPSRSSRSSHPISTVETEV